MVLVLVDCVFTLSFRLLFSPGVGWMILMTARLPRERGWSCGPDNGGQGRFLLLCFWQTLLCRLCPSWADLIEMRLVRQGSKLVNFGPPEFFHWEAKCSWGSHKAAP